MKKIIHREIFQANPRKREVSVDETVYKTGTVIHKRKSCKYFIRDKVTSRNVKELEKWIEIKKEEGVMKNCHVFRELNTTTGVNKVICKVMGEFFAIRGENAFKILYVNEIKMELETNISKNQRGV